MTDKNVYLINIMAGSQKLGKLMIKTIYSPDIGLFYMQQCAMLIGEGSGILVSCKHHVSCYSLDDDSLQVTRVFNDV